MCASSRHVYFILAHARNSKNCGFPVTNTYYTHTQTHECRCVWVSAERCVVCWLVKWLGTKLVFWSWIRYCRRSFGACLQIWKFVCVYPESWRNQRHGVVCYAGVQLGPARNVVSWHLTRIVITLRVLVTFKEIVLCSASKPRTHSPSLSPSLSAHSLSVERQKGVMTLSLPT